ncbi:MAG: sulfatase-like hydrolase/transferase [Deltaproteobacteria bacterium]|nr:sulfatase-like hydrolase/transferase [Deltaproteobacteria bacterium]
MSRLSRHQRKHARLALIVLNLAIVVTIAALVWVRRVPGEPPVTPEEAVPLTVDWAQRLAPDATEADAACPGCNVLLVSLDIFRPDHLACFGSKVDTGSHICDLAARSAVFEDFIVHAYQTPVSMMSMFTGRYPSRSGFTNFAAVLPPEVPTLPEALSRAGYETLAMGSSFEVMSDMSAQRKDHLRFRVDGLNPGMSFSRGFDRFVFSGHRNVPTDAIGWLAEPRDRPFFLWLILGTLHWPYGAQAEPSEAARFDPPGYEGPLAETGLGFETLSRIYRDTWYPSAGAPPVALDEADVAYVNARYDVGLWTVDGFVGELMAAFPPEILQKTLIVLHGVHGEDLGEHDYFGHYDVYDTEVRSTLIVLSPRRRTEGTRIRGQVEGVDLGPTILDLVGLPALEGADGRSVAPELRAGVADLERPAFTQRLPLWEDIFRYRADMPADYVARIDPILDRAVYGDTAMRTMRWKLIHRRSRAIEAQVSWWTYLSGAKLERPEWELYDLLADPTEQHDVLAQHPDVAAELQAELLAWEARTGADRDPPRGAPPSAAPGDPSP